MLCEDVGWIARSVYLAYRDNGGSDQVLKVEKPELDVLGSPSNSLS